jgi:hypothetical protein
MDLPRDFLKPAKKRRGLKGRLTWSRVDLQVRRKTYLST